MRFFKFILLFSLSILLFSNIPVLAEECDSYILKLKDEKNFKIISAEEKNLLCNKKITTYSINNSRIEYIEPNYDVYLHDVDEINWNFNTVNANIPQEYGCYGNEVKIAVIDSGVYQHDLLKNQLLIGHNFINNTTDTNDNIGHGTFVSSIICMQNTNTYTEGISSKAKVVPLKCFDGNKASVDKICDAIKYAVDISKCSIINMSFGLTNNSIALKEAIEYALSKNVILVASVGNSGSSALTYPAAYNGVIGVGAVNKELKVCSFSQHNSSVDVVAPGETLRGILTAGNDKNSGTSFSAPHVSAAAAIALCIDDKITPQEFSNLIQTTSTDLGETGYDFYYGNGLLDIGKISKHLINEQEIFMSPINIENSTSKVTVVNNRSSTSAEVVIADYIDETLYKCTFLNLDLPSKERVFISFPKQENNIKYFIWSDMEKIIPLTKSREYIGNGE